MDKEQTKQAILGFVEFFKGIHPKCYKGMTNGEVIKAMFGDDKVSEFMGYARIMARVGNWFNDSVVAEFDKDWWNSPYEPQENCDTCKHKDDGWDSEHCDGCCGNHSGFEPQERSDHNLKMWHDIFEEEKRRTKGTNE